MKEIKTVELYENGSVDSALLLIISKLSITQPEESLRLLAMCAKDDLPKQSVLKYAINIVENDKYLS